MSTVKKLYNEENIDAALANTEEKSTLIKKTAFKYGIPFSTLIGRRNNNDASLRDQAQQPYSRSVNDGACV